MSPIKVPRESLLEPANWETNGQSPGNSPMAKLQAAAQLFEMSMNPMTGLDPYEITAAIIKDGPLGNARNLQRSREAQSQLLNPALPPMVGGPVGPDGLPQAPLDAGAGNPASPGPF